MKKILLLSVAAALFLSTSANAGTDSVVAPVTIVMAPECVITQAPALSYTTTGITRDLVKSALVSTMTMQYVCSRNISPVVTIDGGMNETGGMRAMNDGNGNLLKYKMLKSSDNSEIAPGGTLHNGSGSSLNTVAATFVYDPSVSGQDAASLVVGNYSDTVNFTVSF